MKVFEEIWDKVAKPGPEGGRLIRYEGPDDLVFIYCSGFVDADKYPLDEWVKAFEDSKQPDKTYHVTYDQWLAKEKFYYQGPVREPFDPMKIPERVFTKPEFIDLVEKCIVPSTQVSKKTMNKFIQEYERRGFFKTGKFMMNKNLKSELNDFVVRYPSPLRILEINVGKLVRGEAAQATVAAADQSRYVEGDSKIKTTQAQLEAILHGKISSK